MSSFKPGSSANEMMTLVWDADDVADVFRSQMTHEGPHYKKSGFPYDRIHCGCGNNQGVAQDADGKTVVVSI